MPFLLLKKLKYRLRNYFGFSQKETNGFIVLLVVMVVFLIAPLLLKNIWFRNDDINYTIEPIKNSLSTTKSSYTNNTTSTLFSFDPNSASQEQLQKLGIETFLAKRIVNYRNKGGHFRIKKDILKIYDFPESLYNKLQSYISLPDSLPTHPYSNIPAFDINTCDTTALIKLKGIGNILAARIINYRTRLGGFVEASQVKEVYGIDPVLAKEIKHYLIVKHGFIPIKINLNSSNVDQLSAHPYLTKKEAEVIVNYRNEHGLYTNVEDLSNVKIFTTKQLQKLRPYLKVE